MPTDPPLAHPKGEKPLEQCEEEDVSLEAADSITDNQPPH